MTPTSSTMLLYERFSVPDTVHAADPVITKDIVTGRTLVLFRTDAPGTAMPVHLADALRIFVKWKLRHPAAGESTELFSSPGAIWLAAPDEAIVADLLSELRVYGLFQKPVVKVEPPFSPPPQARTCASCGKAPLKGALHCAACTPTPKVSPGTRLPGRLVGWVLATLVAVTLLLTWLETRETGETGKPKAAPIVQFAASRTHVKPGGAVVLKWLTSGLGSLSIAPGVGAVGASGSRTVIVRQDTTFVLRSGDQAAPPPASVTVNIIRAGPPKAAAEGSPATAAQKAEVEGALRVWELTVSTNDAQAEAALYAPHLERYFLHQNVDNSYVQSYLTNYFATQAQFSNFSYSDPVIGFEEDGTARVALWKHYTLTKRTGETRQMSTRSELHLRMIYGQWKITFERDFKG